MEDTTNSGVRVLMTTTGTRALGGVDFEHCDSPTVPLGNSLCVTCSEQADPVHGVKTMSRAVGRVDLVHGDMVMCTEQADLVHCGMVELL